MLSSGARLPDGGLTHRSHEPAQTERTGPLRRAMTDSFDRHLEPEEIAAYVDDDARGELRASIERHLSACSDCRTEAAEVSRILRTAPRRRLVRRSIWVPAAAAAALAVLWVGPRALRERPGSPHREEAVTTTVAPRPIMPVGSVTTASALTWSSVPFATTYRIRLFDAEGNLLWEREVADTVAAIPDSIVVRSRLSYYWRVEAQTGFDRWAASDLVAFRVQRDGRQ